MKHQTALSLFSGAGGMDVGFARASFRTVEVCELDKDACKTLDANRTLIGHIGGPIVPKSVYDLNLSEQRLKDLDMVFGGPPCQGFSVAGKMDPQDIRSELIHTYFDVVEQLKPKMFVCENVKSLAVLSRWSDVRSELLNRASQHYVTSLVVLNASDFGVPQKRERMFLVGIRRELYHGNSEDFRAHFFETLSHEMRPSETVGEVLRSIGRPGTDTNPLTCTAKISFAKSAVLRKSPFAGMLFNGAGRPMDANGWALTLPASMGGNKTPIVDDDEVYDGKPGFVQRYHKALLEGYPSPKEVPSRLRRLTITESARFQTFPDNYDFQGSKSSIYKQIGNAVPCGLAEAVAKAVRSTYEGSSSAGKV